MNIFDNRNECSNVFDESLIFLKKQRFHKVDESPISPFFNRPFSFFFFFFFLLSYLYSLLLSFFL